jgi:hypothetical protein
MWKTAIALAILAGVAFSAHANDSSAELSTGGLIFVQNPDVEMRSEDLFISAREVHVRYRFFNSSPRDVTVLVLRINNSAANQSTPNTAHHTYIAYIFIYTRCFEQHSSKFRRRKF